MTELAAHGFRVDLPAGWDARITRRRDGEPEQLRGAAGGGGASDGSGATVVATPYPVAHVANFPLPEERGDFGSGAVELMGAGDVLVVVFDYGPGAVGTPLFASQGMPRTLDPDDFDPQALQRVIPGQAGFQAFFTESGRACCLYVVLGSWSARDRLVPLAEQIVASLVIEPLG